MNDAIVLLAMSQIICLGAIAYLYAQVQVLRQRQRHPRGAAARRAQLIDEQPAPRPSPIDERPHTNPPPRFAGGGRSGETMALLARLQESGLDIPALAKRMRRSEEEVRLLLRRQGAGR